MAQAVLYDDAQPGVPCTMTIGESDVAGSRCIIAGLVSAKDNDAAQRIEEIETTLVRFGDTVVGNLIQRRGVSRASKPGGVAKLNSPMNPATLIGSGKAEELAIMASESGADTVVFVNPLKSSQESRLKEITKCRVLSFR
jgi:50S ribosomal subunit-associated GTPase HflX